jgi:hypothetical protein
VCQHQPRCPSTSARDRAAACVLACHPEQSWSLLCNGVMLFDDAGVLVLGNLVVIPVGHPRCQGRPEGQMAVRESEIRCER